jgi:hypothetical protein
MAAVAWTRSEVYSTSTKATSASNPKTVLNPRPFDHTVRQPLAAATSDRSMDLADA